MAVVRVSVAPVMATRSRASEQVTQALLGAPVLVLEQRPRWARIRMDDDYEGWISTAHLAAGLTPSEDWVSITDLWVNLRTRPDYRMPARTVAFIGTCLPLRKRQEGWLGAGLPAGGVGWLEEHRGRVHGAGGPPAPPRPEALLATAHRFLGVPYLWGGCSPMGLDCSGFVQIVYRLHGIRLPRDAHQQAEVGEPVECGTAGSACAAGDAVFFHAAEQPVQISHVGLTLGDGSFIHAAGSDRVRVNRLVDPPYGERLVCARRYLRENPSHQVLSALEMFRTDASGRALI